MRKHRRVVLCLLVVLLSVLPLEQTRAARKPNIVILVADDLGYADVGFHGCTDIPTPNVDALARGGVRFTSGYVTGPYCSPTRAGLLTGRYQQRFGHEFNPSLQESRVSGAGLPLSETTLAERLKAAGYRTAMFGKWHLGARDNQHPLSRGFEEFYGFLSGEHSYLEPTEEPESHVLEGRTPVSSMKYMTEEIADRAESFIKRQQAQPFFLYLPFNAVHTPMQATEKYLKRFEQIADPKRRTYAAMLSAMDDAVGRVMAALRAAKLEEDTLIFFFSDNGGPTMPTTTVNASINRPLRGSKRQTYEGGIRVPFVIHWKSRLPAGQTFAQPVIQLDVLPTVLAAAGVAVKPEWKLDGVNLMPFLTGKQKGVPHETLYWRMGGMMAVRRGDWKLVKTREGRLETNVETLNDLSDAALYNLAQDIGEQNDLAAKHPEKVKELSAVWRQWNQQLAMPLWGMRK
ncbi:MAG TPA: sulfatase [Blastocatellia bacterium]|nr:sulfatase [Blastocatellia bacterium]